MKKIVLSLIVSLYLYTSFFAQSVPCYNSSVTMEVSQKDGKYGFTDINNTLKIDYKYDEPAYFSWFIYAKVERNGKLFFLDTLGNEYLFSRDIKSLSKESKGIDLSFKNLNEIPKAVFDNHQLEFLILNGNNIKEVPKEIANLKNLTYLGLCSNQIEQLPDEISELHNLKFLHLDYNEEIDWAQVFNIIKNYPKNIILSCDGQTYKVDPDALTIQLNLPNNHLEDIAVLQNLTQISLRHNDDLNLENIIPILEKLNKKIIITNDSYAEYCGKDTILVKLSPDALYYYEIGKLNNLVKVDLAGVGNMDGDYLPLEELADVSVLKLNFCTLPGILNIGIYKNAKELDLSFNSIKEFSKDVGMLEKLEYLNLTYNDFHELNLDFEHIPNLIDLNISRNHIYFLSSEIKQLKKLQLLNISGNDFNDFPYEILKLKNLEELYLSDNYFEVIPEKIVRLKNLKVLDLSDNGLIDLPQSLGKLKNLQELKLVGNELNEDTKKRINKALPNCKIIF